MTLWLYWRRYTARFPRILVEIKLDHVHTVDLFFFLSSHLLQGYLVSRKEKNSQALHMPPLGSLTKVGSWDYSITVHFKVIGGIAFLEFEAICEGFKGQVLSWLVYQFVHRHYSLFVVLPTGRQCGEGWCAETKENQVPSQGVHIHLMIRKCIRNNILRQRLYVCMCWYICSLNSILSCIAR